MNNNKNITAWMTIEEASDYLRCSLRYLKEKVALREIPFTQFAGKALFHKSRIDEWMFSKEENVDGLTKVSIISKDINTTITDNCDQDKINNLIQQLIDFNEKFVTSFGKNLKNDLENYKYIKLSEKVYAQLSRWCHPNRNTSREQEAKPIARQISELLYGTVIHRTKHPSYYG